MVLLLTEEDCHVAVAALASVNVIIVKDKLTAPTMQRGGPKAEQQGQFTSSGTIGLPASSGDINHPPPLPRGPVSFMGRSEALPPPVGPCPYCAAHVEAT